MEKGPCAACSAHGCEFRGKARAWLTPREAADEFHASTGLSLVPLLRGERVGSGVDPELPQEQLHRAVTRFVITLQRLETDQAARRPKSERKRQRQRAVLEVEEAFRATDSRRRIACAGLASAGRPRTTRATRRRSLRLLATVRDALDRLLNGTDEADEAARFHVRFAECFRDSVGASPPDIQEFLCILRNATADAAEPDDPAVLPLKVLAREVHGVRIPGKPLNYRLTALACIALHAAPNDSNRGRYCLAKMTERVRKLIRRS